MRRFLNVFATVLVLTMGMSEQGHANAPSKCADGFGGGDSDILFVKP